MIEPFGPTRISSSRVEQTFYELGASHALLRLALTLPINSAMREQAKVWQRSFSGSQLPLKRGYCLFKRLA